ncbi:MAG: tig [Patescibacteria group bacterium]|jgi:trigger factor|nr:tig [Patescibacteria group bacterium]
MLTEKKKLPNSRLKLTITATAAQFKHAFDHELEHISKDVSMPGFRPGKAPAQKVLEKVGRQRVEAGAIDHAISDAYFEVLREEKITPVQNPSVDVEKYEAPNENTKDDDAIITFTAEVDVLPEVKIDGYEKIKLKKNDVPVIEEEEVQKVVDYLLKQRATLKEVPAETELKNEMWADLAYEGSVDGVSREDMKNERHPLVIGEGSLIPGFEEQILGMKTGEERTIEVTFPKDYHASELAGKKAKFEVKVNEMKEVSLPATDEKFAEEYGHPTFEKLKEAIRENLHQEKEQESKQKIEQDVVEELMKIAKFETPQSLVEQELNRMFKESQDRLVGMNFNWETYLAQVKKTAEEVKEEMRPQAEKNVRIGIALGKVIESEGIKDDGEAGKKALELLIQRATA